MILSGELRPGAKLTEVALAARLGVSRGPLREAFRMLEEAGLVRTEKNRGVFVRDLPVEEAIEIFDLRAAMDELVGRRLAESIAAPALKEIRSLVDEMEQAVKAQGRARLPPAQPALPRPAGRAGGQRQADRRLPQADQGAEPVPPPEPGRRRADAGLGQRAPADRQGDRLRRRRSRRHARCSDHVMESKERTIKNHQQGREPRPATAPPPCPPVGAGIHAAPGQERPVISVNGRSYRPAQQPTVVVCVDGCEPDYIAQAVAHGQVPWLKEVLAQRHGARGRLRDARASPTRTTCRS